jgi:small conductance mechanosensitive channel
MNDLAQSEFWKAVLPIVLYFAIAFVIHRLGRLFAPGMARLLGWRVNKRSRPERSETLQGLISGIVAVLAYLGAILASLRLYVQTDTLVWLVGLFAAGFGLSARPIISDFLAGISFLFEDSFSVGEKVELVGVEGVIENVNLRVTKLRGSGGELYVIPNGEIRLIRNFSRGRFSVANIHLKILTDQLPEAIRLLESLSEEAVSLLPNLIEPWQLISESGSIGRNTELTMVCHARFGKAAVLRTRLLALVQERLNLADIHLVD